MDKQEVFASESVTEGSSAPTYETVAALNKKKLENLVNMKMHPHPLLVIIGVFAIMILVYIFWVAIMQSSPEGIWVTESDTVKSEILYSRVYGTITIMENGKVTDTGSLKGSVLTVGEGDKQRIGMWDTNKIYWVTKSGGCSVWLRELALICYLN